MRGLPDSSTRLHLSTSMARARKPRARAASIRRRVEYRLFLRESTASARALMRFTRAMRSLLEHRLGRGRLPSAEQPLDHLLQLLQRERFAQGRIGAQGAGLLARVAIEFHPSITGIILRGSRDRRPRAAPALSRRRPAPGPPRAGGRT